MPEDGMAEVPLVPSSLTKLRIFPHRARPSDTY